jgi:hypothetical protein
VLAVAPGGAIENVEEVAAEVKDRLGDRPPALMTGDECAAYEAAIATTFSEAVPETPTGPGRRPLLAGRRPASGLKGCTRRQSHSVSRHRSIKWVMAT